MERRYVRQVLNAVGGNKTHAARILGIDRRSLYRRLEEPRTEQQRKDEAPKSAGASGHDHPRAPTNPPSHPTSPPPSIPASGGQPGELE
ncbi:MAG TPA: helix-turn-helix domain-containing protein [Kofleriaceae bacterium]|nr:helix-turn-helix domain-containing protein [Kofleriaceae bacterium]